MAVLSKLVIATAGTLPHDTAHIKRWTEANGGTYTSSPNKSTTHLLASKDAYKKPHAAVQHASDLGIWIVSFDWFDDSLQARRKLSEKKYTWDSLRRAKKKSREIKRLGVLADGTSKRSGGGASSGKRKKSKSFFFGDQVAGLDAPFVSAGEDLERRRRERQRKTEAEKSIQPSFLSSTSSDAPLPPSSCSISAPNPSTLPPTTPNPPNLPTQAKLSWKDLYHYYLDATGFEYKITLMRSEPDTNSFARYVVGLLETHTKPHTYCVNVQYTPPATAAATAAVPTPPNTPSPSEPTRLTLLSRPPAASPSTPYQALITPHHTPFPTAFRAFRHLFTDLTLLPWETRFAPSFKAAQAARAHALCIEPYAYKKPAPGLPMGLMPQLAHPPRLSDAVFDPEYTRNAYRLPGLEAPLGPRGVVGARLLREKEEEAAAAAAAEKEQRREEGPWKRRG